MSSASHRSGLPAVKDDGADEFNTRDGLFEYAELTTPNRTYTYAMLGAGRAVYISSVRLIVMKIVHYMSAAADVMAVGTTEVELAKIKEGATMVVTWRGKPIFVRNRTPKDIAEAVADDKAELRDPQPDAVRVQKPEWLVIVGICTHLGCIPFANQGNYGGWFCPCHGSHYDKSGRIRMGPAPLNLDVPPYKFVDGNILLIGESAAPA